MLVQFNVARMLRPFHDSLWNDFKALLPYVHAAAEENPGFLARLEGEDLPSGYIAVGGNPLLMGNLSAWICAEALREFTFSEPHVDLMRRKLRWFKPHRGVAHAVLYRSDHLDLFEARERLVTLRTRGPTPEAFTWKESTNTTRPRRA